MCGHIHPPSCPLWFSVLQPLHNLHKPLQGICPRVVRLLGLKDHVVFILFSGEVGPLVADFGLCLGFGIVQVVTFGLHHQDLSAVEHDNEVGVGMNGAIDLEAPSGNIPVPPLDVIQRGKLPDHLELIFVHILLGGVEGLGHHGGEGSGRNHRGQGVVGSADDLVLLQPAVEHMAAVLGQQLLDLVLDFDDIGIKGTVPARRAGPRSGCR